MHHGHQTTESRKHMASKNFGVPSKAPGHGSYPMGDISHARNAMARASGKSVEGKVDAKAHRLFPSIGKK